jgi:hypothetical protein
MSAMTLVPTTLFFPRYCFPRYCINYEPIQLLKTQFYNYYIYNYHFNTRLLTSILSLGCICQLLNIVIAQMFNYIVSNLSPLSVGGKPLRRIVQGNLQNAYIYTFIDCICSIFLLLLSCCYPV